GVLVLRRALIRIARRAGGAHIRGQRARLRDCYLPLARLRGGPHGDLARGPGDGNCGTRGGLGGLLRLRDRGGDQFVHLGEVRVGGVDLGRGEVEGGGAGGARLEGEVDEAVDLDLGDVRRDDLGGGLRDVLEAQQQCGRVQL